MHQRRPSNEASFGPTHCHMTNKSILKVSCSCCACLTHNGAVICCLNSCIRSRIVCHERSANTANTRVTRAFCYCLVENDKLDKLSLSTVLSRNHCICVCMYIYIYIIMGLAKTLSALGTRFLQPCFNVMTPSWGLSVGTFDSADCISMRFLSQNLDSCQKSKCAPESVSLPGTDAYPILWKHHMAKIC